MNPSTPAVDSQLAQALENLRPLHLPPEIGWWPPAPGWWLLVLLCVVLGVWAVKIWRRGAAQREALRIIRVIESGELAGSSLAQQINVLLRRYAMACYPQLNAQALVGDAWLEFLNRHGAGRDFGGAAAQALTQAPFAPNARVDRGELINLARHWVKRNRMGRAT
ncbi:MAG: hypothetical protein ACI9DC_003147 [Gammaproteobacteria bacterium]|jgi:hypothetical protein